jgi:hypothetical protein
LVYCQLNGYARKKPSGVFLSIFKPRPGLHAIFFLLFITGCVSATTGTSSYSYEFPYWY